MKKLLKKCFFAVASLVYNPTVLAFFQNLSNKLHWYAYAKQLGSLGEASNVGLGLQIRGMKYIHIGHRFTAGKGLTLQAWDNYAGEILSPDLTIGDDVMLTDFVQISCADRISIGNRVLMGQSVFISDNGHGDTDEESLRMPPMDRPLFVKGPVIIEDDVWIGRGATILSGVRIGKGAVIAAGAVVNRDVPSYSVAAGVPARIIKKVTEKD